MLRLKLEGGKLLASSCLWQKEDLGAWSVGLTQSVRQLWFSLCQCGFILEFIIPFQRYQNPGCPGNYKALLRRWEATYAPVPPPPLPHYTLSPGEGQCGWLLCPMRATRQSKLHMGTLFQILRLLDIILNFIYKWGNGGSSKMPLLSFTVGTRTLVWHSSFCFLLSQILFAFGFNIRLYTS